MAWIFKNSDACREFWWLLKKLCQDQLYIFINSLTISFAAPVSEERRIQRPVLLSVKDFENTHTHTHPPTAVWKWLAIELILLLWSSILLAWTSIYFNMELLLIFSFYMFSEYSSKQGMLQEFNYGLLVTCSGWCQRKTDFESWDGSILFAS